MKKGCVFIVKAMLAGISAAVLLSVILSVYYVLPIHCENKAKNTDYVWAPGSYWAKVTEGISYGRFDSNGFNNARAVENPDIIVLGSSHMEALNVMPKQNTSAVLQTMLENHRVYNMGISAHDIYKVSQYLENSLKRFETVPEVTVIEIDKLKIKEDKVDAVINGDAETPSPNLGRLMRAVQKNPFLRLVNSQKNHGLLNQFVIKREQPTREEKQTVMKTESMDGAYDKLLEYIGNIGKKYNTHIIIMFHPAELLSPNGSVAFEYRDESESFAKKAEENGIRFIDMAQSFSEMYEKEHRLPHGFCTGRIGEGHLNKYGHAAIARELCKAVKEMEADGTICR